MRRPFLTTPFQQRDSAVACADHRNPALLRLIRVTLSQSVNSSRKGPKERRSESEFWAGCELEWNCVPSHRIRNKHQTLGFPQCRGRRPADNGYKQPLVGFQGPKDQKEVSPSLVKSWLSSNIGRVSFDKAVTLGPCSTPVLTGLECPIASDFDGFGSGFGFDSLSIHRLGLALTRLLASSVPMAFINHRNEARSLWHFLAVSYRLGPQPYV